MKNGHAWVVVLVICFWPSGILEAVVPPKLTAGADIPVQLTIGSPRYAHEVFSEIGELTGVTVHIDPRVKDSKIALEIDAASAAEALDAVAEAAGYFWVPVDSSSIAVAEDTPQNRRELIPLVMQVFPLKYAEIRDADRLLRSLVEVRRLASIEALRLVAVRDTADKMIVIEHLIDLIDRSPGQVDFSIDVVVDRGSIQLPEAPTQISVKAYQGLRAEGEIETVARGGIGVLGGEAGALALSVPLADMGTEHLMFELSAPAAEIDGLKIVQIDAKIEFGPNEKLRASTKLTEGETWLLPLPHPNINLVLAVTPVTIEPAQFNSADLEPYWVGTESRITISAAHPAAP